MYLSVTAKEEREHFLLLLNSLTDISLFGENMHKLQKHGCNVSNSITTKDKCQRGLTLDSLSTGSR